MFDLFDVLAYADNHATHPNRLRGEYGGSTGDSHPNSTGNAAATAAFATTTTSLLDIAWAAFAAATPPNPAPAVVLTSPTNAWSVDEPADVAITASATDADGITSVRFYAESVLIGVATSAPYAVVWSNVPAGLFPLTARARDALGATATSPTVWVRVLHTNAVIAGDYDGDALPDLAAVWRAEGNWYIARSVSADTWAFNWGWSAAAPAPGDYDGDGRADFAVFHRETGNWYVRRLTGLTLLSGVNWGWGETPAIPCDFDGDAVADMAIYFPATAQWFVRKLNGDVLSPGRNWGWSDTEPVLRQYQLNRMLNPGEW